jgi:hypothetical protein
VLWALGSMLGATQTIDMVTSLKKNYGQVEVVVINVDLHPNLIDTVVIGDRLYSLPIQVEGREVNMELGTQMDVEDGADDKQTGADESLGNQEQGSSGTRGKEKGEGSGQQKSQSNGPKQNSGANKEQSVGTVAGHGFVADDFFHSWAARSVRDGSCSGWCDYSWAAGRVWPGPECFQVECFSVKWH